jgi:hypothetical protein
MPLVLANLRVRPEWFAKIFIERSICMGTLRSAHSNTLLEFWACAWKWFQLPLLSKL